MTDDAVKNIVELLKGTNNSAAELVYKGDLDGAIQMYELAEETSERFKYTDGVLLNRIYIAKVNILKDELKRAIEVIDTVLTHDLSPSIKRETDKFFREASLTILKKGMVWESEGDLKNALHAFEIIVPYLNKKRADIVEKEIALLRSKVE